MQLDVKSCFADPSLEVMNFLNEVVEQHPEAISFAPGRPAEALFQVEQVLSAFETYVRHRAESGSRAREQVLAEIGQYGPTAGIITDLIARQLARDEGIAAAPEDVLVTTGAQEAMAVLVLALFEPARDALLVSDPTYIGITGLAAIQGIRCVPVPAGPHGLTAEAVAAAVARVRRSGLRPRALYDIPDFNNPLGTTMPRSERLALLQLAEREGFFVFEDNPYGTLAYDGEREPTLKSLDRTGVVVYIGSFAKTILPGLRVGFLVAGQRTPSGEPVMRALSQVKSLTTVNTAAIVQAMVGGVLLAHDCSLRPLVERRIDFYRRNRDHMLRCLEARLGAGPAAGAVSWRRPGGGFFIPVSLPFRFDDAALARCVERHRVIVCPMSFFALGSGCERMARLSFSYVTEAQIEQGIEGFARFVAEEVAVGSERRSA
jgi:(S)-3,5-dihydroxyphenylglycine transaminase